MTPGMSWLCAMRPSPICPMRRRLFAPNARDGTNRGAIAAVTAAVLITSRRVYVMRHRKGFGRSREYIRGAAPSLPTSGTALLVSQRVDGIEARRLAGRVQPEHDADAGTDCQRCHHDSGA